MAASLDPGATFREHHPKRAVPTDDPRPAGRHRPRRRRARDRRGRRGRRRGGGGRSGRGRRERQHQRHRGGRGQPRALGQDPRGDRGDRRRRGGGHDRPHLPAARGRQDRTAQQALAEDARRSLDGVHAGGGARVHRDPRRPRQGGAVHDQAQHRGGRLRRHRGARPGRHRPGGGDAGDGGQGVPVQGVRGRRRLPDLPRHQGPRRDRAHGEADGPRLRGDQPRGHLRAALLRDRGAPPAGARHPRVPRRPARHRGGGDGRAAERREAHRPAPGGPAACW